MDTTAAAAQANVTVATIRTWCRRNVIAATKQAGRWTIDTASLAHRITLGHTHANRKATTVTTPADPAEAKRAGLADAAATRDRVTAALTIPPLTGTPAQIQWADNIRRDAIERAIAHIRCTKRGIVYRLGRAATDPLRMGNAGLWPEPNPNATDDEYDAVMTARGLYNTEADLIAAANAALAHNSRTNASWWIELTKP